MFGRVPLSTLVAAALPFLAASCTSDYDKLPLLPPAPNAGSAYLLGPGDKLQIVLFGATDNAGGGVGAAVQPTQLGGPADQYTVTESGTVGAPLVGEVPAAGLTVAQVRDEIAKKLAQGFLRDPKVGVEVAAYRPFYILGEVNHPGNYPFVPHSTVLSAVATAGGYSYRAVTQWAVVDRKDGDSVIRGKASPSTPILPDDIVTIPERYF